MAYQPVLEDAILPQPETILKAIVESEGVTDSTGFAVNGYPEPAMLRGHIESPDTIR